MSILFGSAALAEARRVEFLRRAAEYRLTHPARGARTPGKPRGRRALLMATGVHGDLVKGLTRAGPPAATVAAHRRGAPQDPGPLDATPSARDARPTAPSGDVMSAINGLDARTPEGGDAPGGPAREGPGAPTTGARALQSQVQPSGRAVRDVTGTEATLVPSHRCARSPEMRAVSTPRE